MTGVVKIRLSLVIKFALTKPRLAKAKENEQCDDVGNTYPTVVRS